VLGQYESLVRHSSLFYSHFSWDAILIFDEKRQYFLTTDDKLLKKLVKTREIIVINPVNFIPILESM